MTQRSENAAWLRAPETRRWVAIGVFLVLYTLLLTALSRYFEWDEAVYFSQSGPLPGAVTSPLYYSPSRELGTAVLAAVLRIPAGSSIVFLRLGWVIVSAIGIVLAFRQIGKLGPRWSGEIAALVFGTFWITTGYMGALFGSLLGALWMLLATALYLRLVDAEAQDLRAGALLGVALAGGFSMRTVETVLVVLVLLVHAATYGRAVWRQWRAVLAAMTTFVIAFVVPWMIHSQLKYGSPVGHATAWIERRKQRAGGDEFPIGWHNGAPEWFQALLGDSHVPAKAFPRWPGVIIGIAIVALAAGLIWLLVRRVRGDASDRGRSEPSHLGLLTVLSLVSFGLFFFLVADDRDRYAFYGTVFAVAVAGQLLARSLPALQQRLRGKALPLAAAIAAVAWLVANAALASFYDEVRARKMDIYRRVTEVVAEAADGRDCQLLFAEQVAPYVAVGSPCRVASARNVEDLDRRGDSINERGEVAMVFWRREDGPFPGDDEWRRYKRFSVRPKSRKVVTLYVRES